ncbi:Crossover junction endonuclease eme1b [Thalictrum thalictroides]|uniref:Crossover junction endonuclease eme1b n=1 Tax=Thalictrum thalictroides TaxID=46969 RepID=A0A7J6WR63_THATH|nr:Crossover junction endonuclease eme1b [Thalictrum thalictroides]
MDAELESLLEDVLDDNHLTPKKPSSVLFNPKTSYVPDSPLSSDPFESCRSRFSDPKTGSLPTSTYDKGGCSLICLESDNESESDIERKFLKENEDITPAFEVDPFAEDFEVNDPEQQVGTATKQIHEDVAYNEEQSNKRDETKAKKKKTKEEKMHLAEEKKLKKEQEDLQRKALKAEAAEAKKLQKEQQKWEKGKSSLKFISVEIDAKVVELGAVGGHLISKLAEKGISYSITSNPIERSILWKLCLPEQDSELSSKRREIPYVLLVYEADEYCSLILNDSLTGHVSRVQSRYSSHTICYLTNKLISYINKREQAQYKNLPNSHLWIRPPVEEVLSKITTNYARVHSRQCRDEAELADHVAGLTYALAMCQSRPKLTQLSIYANGVLIPKDLIGVNSKGNSVWLKALIAIPKVQPRFAVAICKKYPTMKSLLSVYMDPSKSVYEKEFLLKDLPTEGLLGTEDKKVGAVCSKRVYRILMAQNGKIKTDDVEFGADFF